MRIHKAYQPSTDEQARQAFVGALKKEVNHGLESALTAHYETTLLPKFIKAHGAPPAGRDEGHKLFADAPLFRLWGALNYLSQDLLWETCGETVDRLKPVFEARAQDIEAGGIKGSLALDPAISLPSPIGQTEIHRQPGGYFLGDAQGDLAAALLYTATVEIYTRAKGFKRSDSEGSTQVGRMFAAMVQKFAPQLKPRRILDMGCGVGHMAIGMKEVWPDAEVVGVDLSASFVRLGHLWAEDMDLALDFIQADAAATGLESDSFDLVVSQIMFHETWHDKVPAIMREAHRLLAPNGLFFNVDIPYQPERLTLPQLVTNAWQVEHNGEPFWTGFADTDVATALRDAGFGAASFTQHMSPGGGREYFIFGGSKAAADQEEAA
ncbi:MAG: class I SAM-dependent methyltransferase [Congregibacter sp.]